MSNLYYKLQFFKMSLLIKYLYNQNIFIYKFILSKFIYGHLSMNNKMQLYILQYKLLMHFTQKYNLPLNVNTKRLKNIHF